MFSYCTFCYEPKTWMNVALNKVGKSKCGACFADDGYILESSAQMRTAAIWRVWTHIKKFYRKSVLRSIFQCKCLKTRACGCLGRSQKILSKIGLGGV